MLKIIIAAINKLTNSLKVSKLTKIQYNRLKGPHPPQKRFFRGRFGI